MGPPPLIFFFLFSFCLSTPAFLYFHLRIRPYVVKSTASRPICEVKPLSVCLVLRWVTTVEPHDVVYISVFFFCNFFFFLPTWRLTAFPSPCTSILFFCTSPRRHCDLPRVCLPMSRISCRLRKDIHQAHHIGGKNVYVSYVCVYVQGDLVRKRSCMEYTYTSKILVVLLWPKKQNKKKTHRPPQSCVCVCVCV